MIQLPIDEIVPRFRETFRSHRTILLHAPPGAGKTTRIPLVLLDSVPPAAGRILMLEPRRIAAIAAARHMAQLLGEEVGETVGYSIRFESVVSRKTRIEVITEGILTRRIQHDPELSGVAVVIFDEFHERSMHADLGLVLCREVQQLRPDLSMIIMSATLDVQQISLLLDHAPIISSSGRSFPVEHIYCDDSGKTALMGRVSATVMRALRETEGDLLVFLPGSGEIRGCAALLTDALRSEVRQIEVCQLFGDLPIADQQKAIQIGNIRKVVLATSIAETSLTIEGVRVVIDSGVSRRLQYDPGTGLNRLVTVRESRASAEQRAGRGGRVAPGVCYRLFSLHTLNAMAPFTPPEITVAELSGLLLELAAWGVTDPDRLEWLDAPPAAAVATARSLLCELDLLAVNGTITEAGTHVVRLPLHPRLGRLLLRAKELGCASLGCQIAALLSERDIFRRTDRNFQCQICVSDLEERLEALQSWQVTGRVPQHIDLSALKTVVKTTQQLRKTMGIGTSPPRETVTGDTLARLLLAAYPDRVARRRDSGEGYLLASGRGALLSVRSGVRGGDFIVAPLLDAGSRSDATIHLASEVTEAVLREERGRHIQRKITVCWDEREQRVNARQVESLGSVELSARTVVPPPDRVAAALIGAVRASRLQLLTLDDAFRQLQGRLQLLHRSFPEQEWLDVSDSALLESLELWLMPSLSAATNSARKLAQLSMAEVLMSNLSYQQKRLLDELAPAAVAVPSGSRIRIDYGEEVPVLAVKLQELFGLALGPTVCNGRVPLLLHLLSPAGRPIQVTRDLRGFWDGAYTQVKKELKGRYPKHPWPEDPWSAVPTRRLKPKG